VERIHHLVTTPAPEISIVAVQTLATPAARQTLKVAAWRLRPHAVSWLQVSPLALILIVFFALPTLLFVVVSFFDYDRTGLYPDFILDNYRDVLTSPATIRTYVSSLRFAVIVWAITLLLGFNIAYFLIFHVRSSVTRAALFLLCIIPFWTSAIIRTIAWIPFLGRNGAFNWLLMETHLTSQPLDFLLFSDFAVIVAYVHLYTILMIGPIANAMARIDPALLEAARDGGASRWQTMTDVIIPLSKTGIALGSILVLTQVMGDYLVVKQMSGGQSASIVSALATEIQAMQYPPAAASAIVLVAVVALLVALLMRVVDVRSELVSKSDVAGSGRQAHAFGGDKRPPGFYGLALLFGAYLVFLYGPMLVIYVLSFQGPEGGVTFPMVGVSLAWFESILKPGQMADVPVSFARSLALAALVSILTVVIAVAAGFGFRRRFPGSGALFYITVASLVMPSLLVGFGIGLGFQMLGWQPGLFTSALGAQLTWTLPFGVLTMFAVINRFDRCYDEAASDLGASAWQRLVHVSLPILLPGILGIAVGAFTLSYDEYARTTLTVGSRNTLPLEIYALISSATSPMLFAIGTVTTALSFLLIGTTLWLIVRMQRRRGSLADAI
jgi:putative spermidine/putrescine transport system permease protein